MARTTKRKTPGKVVGTRIPERDYQRLHKLAAKRGVNVSSLVRQGVRQIMYPMGEAA